MNLVEESTASSCSINWKYFKELPFIEFELIAFGNSRVAWLKLKAIGVCSFNFSLPMRTRG